VIENEITDWLSERGWLKSPKVNQYPVTLKAILLKITNYWTLFFFYLWGEKSIPYSLIVNRMPFSRV
jgi:hypothetical protein